MSATLTSPVTARSNRRPVPAQGPLTRAVGAEIKRLRRAREWSHDDLAERTGISRSTLIRMEQGATPISMDKLELLAVAFDVEPVEFFPG